MSINFINSPQDLIVLGINHETASFAVRQKVAFAKEHIQPALVDFLKVSQITEAALLSTCNRTEFYCGSSDVAAITQWWENYLDISTQALEPYLYCHVNADAVRHMMQVACGLKSMILGESQILGQLKEAFEIAQSAGALKKRLSKLFQASFFVAKQIRTQTSIAKCPVSIAYAATHLAKKMFPDITKANVLLIGAGENIELVARHLCQLGIQQLKVANRSIIGAQRLAQRFGGEALLLEDIAQYLPSIDIVISSTASPHPIVSFDLVQKALKGRKNHPIFMVDLAMPCDIDPLVAQHEDVYLYTIDDLHSLVEINKASRQQAALEANRIIDLQVNHYMHWLGSQQAIQKLCLFRDNVDKIKIKERDKALQLLQKGIDPKIVIHQLTHNLTQKIMHQPTILLKASVKGAEKKVGTVAELFENLG